jgi:radical SAM/Cys-rich protein
MQDTHDLLVRSSTDFPPLRRHATSILQVNLGYLCNLSCVHCHVNAGPTRTELMDRATVAMDGEVIDRCNLTILLEPGYEDLPQFLADNRVHVVASLPCYLEENVNAQRGKGVYQGSIEAIRRLNAQGYGSDGLLLDLVYNPTGPNLPPPQEVLEADYKRELDERFGLRFNSLLTITNMPISRFGAVLLAHNQFNDYMQLLRDSFNRDTLPAVMCRATVSVDYQGYLYDCDFNQMLDMPLGHHEGHPHLSGLLDHDLEGEPIYVADHCFGCTAGAGSSCSGALE